MFWTEERKLLAKTASDFARAELAPVAEHLDETEGFNEKAFRKLGEIGLLGVTIPEAYGGAGLGSTEATLLFEKLGEHCASTTLSVLAHSILCANNLAENASNDQKTKYLPKLVSGEWIGAMAMTEPGAGSDALGMTTTATRQGDSYLLKGSKLYITNGPMADVLIVYAKTGSTKKHISTFIVEKGTPGFSVSKKLRKMGMRASPTAELSFDQCRIPAANLIGKENDSVSHMMKNLNIERITISGISLGIAQACLDYSVKFAKERSQFGTPISQFQMIQEKVANMAAALEAARALTYQASQTYDQGGREMTLGAMAKLVSARMATQAGLDAIQILGGAGYMKEYPVERYMRDAKLMEIGAGTNEVMQILIARAFMPAMK